MLCYLWPTQLLLCLVILTGEKSLSQSKLDSARLNSVLENWQTMPLEEQPIYIKSFAYGLNNETHLISSNTQYRVLKLFTRPNSKAITAQNIAAQKQIAPRILYTNGKLDLALIEYIDSVTASPPLEPHEIKNLAKTLKQLHSSTGASLTHQLGNFNLIGSYIRYLGEIGANNDFVYSLHKQIEPIVSLFLNDKTQWCICHNDLVKENCFITEQGVKFIDWEYCQVNNPWFDLSTLIYSFKMDDQQTNKFIHAYNPQWLSTLNSPLYFSAMVSMLWCDVLWFLARGYDQDSHDIKKKLNDLQIYISRFNQV